MNSLFPFASAHKAYRIFSSTFFGKKVAKKSHSKSVQNSCGWHKKFFILNEFLLATLKHLCLSQELLRSFLFLKPKQIKPIGIRELKVFERSEFFSNLSNKCFSFLLSFSIKESRKKAGLAFSVKAIKTVLLFLLPTVLSAQTTTWSISSNANGYATINATTGQVTLVADTPNTIT